MNVSNSISHLTHFLVHLQVHSVSEQLPFRSIPDRRKLLLTLCKVFKLLQCMAAALPPLPARQPLFVKMDRGQGATLTMMSQHCVKSICEFEKFAAVNHTSLNIINRAYNAATVAAAEQKPAPPFLITALTAPRVKRHKYRVETTPVGYAFQIATEQVLDAFQVRAVRTACLPTKPQFAV